MFQKLLSWLKAHLPILKKSLQWLVLGGIVLWAYRLRQPTVVQTPTPWPIVVAGPGFMEEEINEKVYFSTVFRQSMLSKDSLGSIVRATFTQNSNLEAVYLGKSYHSPEAWVYFRVYNPTATPQKLVVHTPHLRSDGLALYRWQQAMWRPLAQEERATPFSQRPLPFSAFGLPFTVSARDTIALLLRSDRKIGVHELNLSLSKEKNFVENAIIDNSLALFRVSGCFVLTFVVLTLGVLFRQKKMIYYGLLLAAVTATTLSINCFFDTFPFPTGIALQANSVLNFCVFLANILFHPYAYVVVKSSLTSPKRYQWGAGGLILLNGLVLLLFLLPTFSHTNFIITNSTWVLMGINMVWMLYYARKAYYSPSAQASVKSHLAVALLVFLPTILQIIVNFLGLNQVYPTFDANYYNSFFIILPAAYIGIVQFKDELVTKQAQLLGLNRVKQNMDLLRRTEIELVGRNLHDQVGNTLASALGYLNMKQLKTETVKALILNAINELRMISHNLVKDDRQLLSDKVTVLTERLNDFAATNFIFDDFSRQKMDTLPMLTQQNLYAVIQELLTNIVKHAQAHETQVQFFDTEGILRVVVEDDGIGFDTQHVSSGIGLQNIRKRVALMKGQLTIDSTPQGTTTILTLTP